MKNKLFYLILIIAFVFPFPGKALTEVTDFYESSVPGENGVHIFRFYLSYDLGVSSRIDLNFDDSYTMMDSGYCSDISISVEDIVLVVGGGSATAYTWGCEIDEITNIISLHSPTLLNFEAGDYFEITVGNESLDDHKITNPGDVGSYFTRIRIYDDEENLIDFSPTGVYLLEPIVFGVHFGEDEVDSPAPPGGSGGDSRKEPDVDYCDYCDLNEDMKVNFVDISIFLYYYNQFSVINNLDLIDVNKDKLNNLQDLSIIIYCQDD